MKVAAVLVAEETLTELSVLTQSWLSQLERA